MHRQKLLTRSCGDDDIQGVERGGLCSRLSPDASSSDSASDSASAAPSPSRRRRRSSCSFGAFYGGDGDGMLSDCCGRAAVLSSWSFFFTGLGGRRSGSVAAAAGMAVLLTVLLALNAPPRDGRYTRSLVEIREKYSTAMAKGTTVAAKEGTQVPTTATTTTTMPPPVSTSADPVLIALVNDFYFGDRYARAVPGCIWRDENLPCEFTADEARFNASDALA